MLWHSSAVQVHSPCILLLLHCDAFADVAPVPSLLPEATTRFLCQCVVSTLVDVNPPGGRPRRALSYP